MGSDILKPKTIQLVGLGTFLFFCGFWAFTDRVEPALLAGSGTLYSAGLIQRASNLLGSKGKDEEPPEEPPKEP